MLFDTILYVYCPEVNTEIVCCPEGLEVLQWFITGCSSVEWVWTSNGTAHYTTLLAKKCF